MKLVYLLTVASIYWLSSVKLISKGEIDSIGSMLFFSLVYLAIATISASIIFND